MSKVTMNLQDSFLNQVRKEGTEVRMVLLDGTTLNGVVKGFDNFTVILSSRGEQHLEPHGGRQPLPRHRPQRLFATIGLVIRPRQS